MRNDRTEPHYACANADGTGGHGQRSQELNMAQAVKYSILVGPGGYIILDLDTADIVSGEGRRQAAEALRNAINAEFPQTDRIERPHHVRLMDEDGNIIADVPGTPIPDPTP
jgi:hypothetical protein